MKKVCFVVSHLGSGSGSLVASLNAHPQCEIHQSATRYESPSSLRWLFRMGHKCRDASAVYGDHLLFNASISNREVYRACKPIVVVRPARHSLNEIIRGGYRPEGAAAYYRFRLRRICEFARRCPWAVLLEWDDLAKEGTLRIIEDYLGLSKPLIPISQPVEPPDACPERLVEECQEAYERYHYYLSGLKLRRPLDKTA